MMSTTTIEERYAGVDVSKARFLDVAVRPTGERYSVTNEPEGINTLIERLGEAGPPQSWWSWKQQVALSALLRQP